MKKFLFYLITILFLLGACNGSRTDSESGDYPFQPVDFTKVKFNDKFWSPRLDTNRINTIPYDFLKCEETGRIGNFAVACGIRSGSFLGRRYDDSDVFKIMEGAAYSLHTFPDPRLDNYLDSIISLVADAQEDDGYLYTCRTINPDSLPSGAGDKRWSYLKSSHELYNIGHMYEAAVAHFLATGKRNFLNVAMKSADLICKTFGPGKDQLHGVPGHQEIEIGLAKLYRVTGEKKYLEMAKYFLDQRGNAESHELYTYGENGDDKEYVQDHKPVVEQNEAVGHAVRAAYMYSGMADIAALTGNSDYIKAIDLLWENVAGKKLYITGGIGSKSDGEAFGKDYELPNLTAYCETCAGIANILWNQRLFLLHGDAKYIDVLERTLYNNFLAGVSIHGDKFFYSNPLESDGSHQRSPWFSCACCPTNVVRTMPSLPGYVYAKSDNELYINLFIGNKAEIEMPFGKLEIKQETDYPWEGVVKILIGGLSKNQLFTLNIRIPGWARNEAIANDLYRFMEDFPEKTIIQVNGKNIDYSLKNGYAQLNREWQSGDVVLVNFPMPVRKIITNENVSENNGKLCFQRGPLVYAAEGVDNGMKVRNLLLDKNIDFKLMRREDLIDGITILKGNAISLSRDQLGKTDKIKKEITLIPYYSWAHRGPTEMLVWFPYEESAASPSPPPTIASKSKLSASFEYDNILALNDQVIPQQSNNQTISRFTFWDHKGTEEWVQYNFEKAEKISKTAVFWFDDGPNGGCRTPKSWKLLYRNKTGVWKEIDKYTEYLVKKDELNAVTFIPVETDAVRLVVHLQSDFSGGILEWQIQ